MRRDLQEEPESTIGTKPQHEAAEEQRPEEPKPERGHKVRWEEEEESKWSPETRHPPPPEEPIRK